ncbi:uncharacterized protein LOC62_05G007346 [Vanrija pseudolonga]|uniref:Uncharacterized protein n=1 Tax=Vanrija pseudolonga TaxID=143232 RepID=A0AAF0YCA7_9TREE|nr:hypothetical protein LOC62_05G007346 [Vanrija pseudolonga]
MARMATYKSRSKRVRTDAHAAPNDPREREQLESLDDDEPATRMASYLERLALEDSKTSDDLKIRRSLSEGVAALGAARWARARRSGVARMSARKVELVEVAADSVPQLDPEPDAEYLADHDDNHLAPECYDVILPPPLRPSLHHPVAPRTSIVELPEDNEDIVDDLADWDSSDDHVVTPPPHLQAGSCEYHVDYHQHDHHAVSNFIRHRSNSLGLSHVGVRDSIDFDSGLMNSLPREGTLSAAESGPLWEHFQARLAGFSLRDRMAPRTQYDEDVVNNLDDEATWSPGFNPNLGALPEGADLDEVDPFDYEEASPQDSFEDSPPESQGVGGAVASQPQWAPLFHPRLQAMDTSATPSPMMRLPERLLEEAGTPAGTPMGAPASASYQGVSIRGGIYSGHNLNVNVDIENDLDELDEDEGYLDSQGYEAGGEWGEQHQCGDYDAELGHGIRFSNHEPVQDADPDDLDELDDEW